MQLVIILVISLIMGAKSDGDVWSEISHSQQKAIADTLFQDCPGLKEILEPIKSFPTDTSKVTLTLYNGKKEAFPIATAGKQILASKYFDRDLPTIIYCHGYFEDLNFEGTRVNTNAFLERGGFNVLAVDASSMIRFIYLYAAESVKFVGKALGRVLAEFVNGGVDPGDIHLIGFSLGAHIVGFSGKELQMSKAVKVGRITGLDPAGPCYFKQVKDLRLRETDAEFVDVIHTDAGALGIVEPLGHADFFPNGGTGQPGATIFTLNHLRAYQLFAETVKDETGFLAIKCHCWESFKDGTCPRENPVYMGYGVSRYARGSYYLWTRAFTPYKLFERGINTYVSYADMWGVW